MNKNVLFSVFLFICLFVYFFCFQDYFFKIPVSFKLENNELCPFTSVEIEGKFYEVGIDLGSRTALTLKKELLESIEKTLIGTNRWMDFRGKKYELPLYQIPNAAATNFRLKKVDVAQESFDFITKESKLGREENLESYSVSGRLGRNFFAGKNFLLDFQNSRIIVCPHLKNLCRDGYDIKKLAEVPFEYAAYGILLKIETDLGIHDFILDTGASFSVLRAPKENEPISVEQEFDLPVLSASVFRIGGIDFGPRHLPLFNFGIDKMEGILGMDFLKEYAIYFDFKKSIAYIGKSSEVLGNLNQ